MKNTTAMMISIMPVDTKLTQTAGFFRTVLSLFGERPGGTTTGDVCGVIVVKLLLHKSPLQQQKITDWGDNTPTHSDWLQTFSCSQQPCELMMGFPFFPILN